MSILIKVKLSQSLVGIRIESTRDERRAVEERKKKRNKNAAAAEVCLLNADRSKRLNDREATFLYHYYAREDGRETLKYSYFVVNRNFLKPVR